METAVIRTELGGTFAVRLKSNPTTGYSWAAEFDRDALELVSDEYERISPAIGGGGQAIFVFLSLKQGRTTITMRYRRPWEDGTIETMIYFVEVV